MAPPAMRVTQVPGLPVRSPAKVIGDLRLGLLVFPQGVDTQRGRRLSAYVEALPGEAPASDWSFPQVPYCIAVVHGLELARSTVRVDTSDFSAGAKLQGWDDLLGGDGLDPESGWLDEAGALHLRAAVRLQGPRGTGMRARLPAEYDSRAETGHVSLREDESLNGAAHSVLQSLFHLGCFREALESVDPEAAPSDRVSTSERGTRRRVARSSWQTMPASALKDVFRQLEASDQPVDVGRLRELFGRGHPLEEREAILGWVQAWSECTPAEGCIQQLFSGELGNPTEAFSALRLRGPSVEEALCSLTITAGRTLARLPTVLTLWLERPEADLRCSGGLACVRCGGLMRADARAGADTCYRCSKVRLGRRCPNGACLFFLCCECCERIEHEAAPFWDHSIEFRFHPRLDLSPYLRRGARRGARRAHGASIYSLHSVVVAETVYGSSRYHALVKPLLGGPWLRFWESCVTRCSEYSAVEDNYGGADSLDDTRCYSRLPLAPVVPPAVARRQHSASMLVYVREAETSRAGAAH
mmetsp:Transcript_67569/g.218193  ORF Transcript_67569/g.218193 Transcript_67569/m.218193 type:complete len:529 (+) Transcript_67569:541-2127(+)